MKLPQPNSSGRPGRSRAHLDTTTGARAVPARSTSLGRGDLENSGVFTPDKPLRTGTVRGPAVTVSRSAARSLSARSAFTLPEVLIASALGLLVLTGAMAFMSFAGKSLSGATTQTFLNQQAGSGMELILGRVRLATSIETDVAQNSLTLGFDDNFEVDGTNNDGKPYNDVDHTERFQFQNGDGNDNTIADNVLVYIPNTETTNSQTVLRSVRKLPNTPIFALTNFSTVIINLGIADAYTNDWRQSVELQLIAVPRNRPARTNIVSILP